MIWKSCTVDEIEIRHTCLVLGDCLDYLFT
jgi:hypothetical protein